MYLQRYLVLFLVIKSSLLVSVVINVKREDNWKEKVLVIKIYWNINSFVKKEILEVLAVGLIYVRGEGLLFEMKQGGHNIVDKVTAVVESVLDVPILFVNNWLLNEVQT